VSESESLCDVAIVGMAARFPGATGLDEYWANLAGGVESIRALRDEELASIAPELRDHPRYVKSASLFPRDIGEFDASFFGFTPREAELMDPQHRILLECAWEALEHAGYDARAYKDAIGIFAGTSLSTYLLVNVVANAGLLEAMGGFQTLIRNDKDYLTTTISYELDLRGPSIAVQTACSSSLVAVHLACQSLLGRECRMALAGGVRAVVPQQAGYLYEDGGILSPDGRCRPFDANARGTIFGSGAGLVVLKRLEDALAERDEIHAVIKGSAINNDGAGKVGFTAPGFEGQMQVIAEALAVADVAADSIGYVEAHGTGTPLGDPIEVSALTRVFSARTKRKGFCALGSVKGNIGHLEAAGGVASLIKTVLALEHEQLPPSLHFEAPNPEIDLQSGPFFVCAKLAPWERAATPRRAGVSSFGIGGTNAHVIVEEAPSLKPRSKERPWQLLTLSAKTEGALEVATKDLLRHLAAHPEQSLGDVAYTGHVGRHAFDVRRFVVCRDAHDAARTTRVFTSGEAPRPRPVSYLFPGQGTQYPNMTGELYGVEPVFREQVDLCSKLLEPLVGVDLRGRHGGGVDLTETVHAQPAIFMIEHALARLWMSFGVPPAAMIGHSIGEWVAACLAGVFSLADALALVVTRAKLMQSMPRGSMLAASTSEEVLRPLLPDGTSIAAVNAPGLVTASGPAAAIDALAGRLSAAGIACRRLVTSHAFHSSMMDPILARFEAAVRAVPRSAPRLRWVSNVTGTWITESEATDPAYWATHLREPVRFADGLRTLFADGDSVSLEVGPGNALTTFAKHMPDRPKDHCILTSLPHATEDESNAATMLTALGRLWLSGAEIDWSAVHRHDDRRRVAIPTYPFERQRYWLASRSVSRRLAEPPDHERHDRPPLRSGYAEPESGVERTIATIWEELLGIRGIGRDDNFFELGGHSLLLISMRGRLEEALKASIEPHVLMEAPTVASMAVRLSSVSPAAGSPLIPIRAEGARRPIFFVHPNAGRLSGFVALSRELGPDQPVYGLEGPGADESTGLTVESIAAANVDALRSVQPAGPYQIVGYSFGGIVAFEMARQLAQRGEQLSFLALLDSMPFPQDDAAGALPDETLLLAWFAWELGRTSRREHTLSFETLAKLDPEARLRDMLEQLGERRLAASDAALGDVRRLFELFRANVTALWRYRPGSYDGPMQVLRARDTPGGNLLQALSIPFLKHVLSAYLADPSFGWRSLCEKRPTVHIVPGNHYTMLDEPHIGTLAAKIKRLLPTSGNDTMTTASRAALVGTWKLLSWELRTGQGELLLSPFGSAVGYLIYSHDGHMSLSIMKANRAKGLSDNPLTSSTEEQAAAAEGYFSYCGKYEVLGDSVVHHIEAALFPNWVGESQVRPFELTKDTLSLSIPSPAGGIQLNNILLWQRVG
jgi:acyl transferase domain-containing protein/thioesterase domain-containing protein